MCWPLEYRTTFCLISWRIFALWASAMPHSGHFFWALQWLNLLENLLSFCPDLFGRSCVILLGGDTTKHPKSRKTWRNNKIASVPPVFQYQTSRLNLMSTQVVGLVHCDPHNTPALSFSGILSQNINVSFWDCLLWSMLYWVLYQKGKPVCHVSSKMLSSALAPTDYVVLHGVGSAQNPNDKTESFPILLQIG